MSLIAWYPLDGNLQNYVNGTDILVNTGNTVTPNPNGKIGTTYYNSSFYSKALISTETFNPGKHQSLFCWVNFTKLHSMYELSALCGQHRYAKYAGMGLTIKYVTETTGYLSVNTGNGQTRTFNVYCGNTLLKANTWYHLGYTYDGANIRLYVNGKLDHDAFSYSGMKVDTERIGIFQWSFGGTNTGDDSDFGNYVTQGKINDVRLYNHTLCQKEITELAKGLCLNYSLQDENCENTTNLVTNNYFEYGWNSYGDGYDDMGFITDRGTPGFRVNNRKTWCGASTTVKIPEPGIYTFSVWCKPIHRDNTSIVQTIYFSGCGWSDQATSVSWSSPGTWQRISLTRNLTTSGNVTLYLICYGGSNRNARLTAEYTMPQIEKKDYATLFTHEVRQHLTFDHSGFKNEPITLHNIDLDHLRFKGENFIVLPQTLKKEDEFTVNLWGYMNDWTQYTRIISCTETGGWNIESDDYGGFRFVGYDKGIGYRLANSSIKKNQLKSGWHMFTFTFDGSYIKGYIDGLQVATSPLFQSHYIGYNSTNSIFVGAESEGNLQNTNDVKFNGRIKNVKFYVTALTPEQILQEYQSKFILDDNCNFYCGDLIEADGNTRLMENSALYVQEFREVDGRGSNYCKLYRKSHRSDPGVFKITGEIIEK